MVSFLYNGAVGAYFLAIRLAALFNSKARRWVAGRRELSKDIPDALARIPRFESRKRIWMHCASLGEFEQGRPVLEGLREKNPDLVILLSFFSPSGYEAVKEYRVADAVFYLPEDNRRNARWLVATLHPHLVLWVKYEFWRHFINALHTQGIPVLLLAGLFRKQQPFFRFYGAVWRDMLKGFRFFFLQNEASASLLQGLGIRSMVVCGDSRFDRVLEIARSQEPLPGIGEFCGNRFVLVAGSTWPNDEQILLPYVSAHHDFVLIVAPHEIDRARMLQLKSRFPGAMLHSEFSAGGYKTDPQHGSRVLIIDSMGLLSRIYRYGQIAYVGGGFNRGGIHNVLEPAVYGMPVVFGPVYQKFSEAVELVHRGVGLPVANAEDFRKVMDQLRNNPDLLRKKSEDAAAYVKSRGGATKVILDYIAENRLLTS